MEAIIISKEQFNTMLNALEEIKTKLNEKKDPEETFLDNQEFLLLMKISKRTAQTWRDEGKISFSQVGNKIYYKLADVEELLEKHYVRSFKNTGSFNRDHSGSSFLKRDLNNFRNGGGNGKV